MKCREVDALASLFKVLSSPTRIAILILCSKREVSTRELREKLGISKPLLLAHIRKLVKAGLLESRLVVDEEKGRVIRLYRTTDFEVCISRDLLGELYLNTRCTE